MDSVLHSATEASVTSNPFPYLVIKNAIPKDLERLLIESFPVTDIITEGRQPGSNLRFSYGAQKVAENERVAKVWRDFVLLHASPSFWKDVVRVFGPHIRSLYPSIETTYGPLDGWRVGVRRSESHDDTDILLDAQICVNTPVIEKPNSVRGPHVDDMHKLLVGLLYLRRPEDQSTGGELLLYRWKDGKPRIHGTQWANQRDVEEFARVPYESGTLVMLINSPLSLHGVTIRHMTEHPRTFLNIVGEVRAPLFNPDDYRESLIEKFSHVFRRV